jgi:uncharacterized protein
MAAVGLLTLEVYIPGVSSLKEKRGNIRPIIARIRKEFNVSVAEIEDMDQLGHMVIGVAAVSVSADYVHGLLQRVAERVRRVAAGRRVSRLHDRDAVTGTATLTPLARPRPLRQACRRSRAGRCAPSTQTAPPVTK